MRFFLPVLGALAILAACSSDDPSSDDGPDGTNDGGTTPGIDGSDPNRPGADSGNDPDAPPPPPRPVVITNETASVNGRTHSYFLGVPRELDPAKSYPVVIVFHGNPSNAETQLNLEPFDNASAGNAILVYPQAFNAGDGAFNWDLSTQEPNNVDVQFVRALPDALVNKGLNIDTDRIFGYGYSGGAFFLQSMICMANDFFRAVTTSAGGAPSGLGYPTRAGNECPICPGGATATLIIHGDQDTEVGAGSGTYAALCQQLNAPCSATTQPTTPSPCVLYDGCPAGAPLEFCYIPGQNHAPWSQAMIESWKFFESQ